MTYFIKNPTPQYEKKSNIPKAAKPIKITNKIISELIDIMRENKKIVEGKYQL